MVEETRDLSLILSSSNIQLLNLVAKRIREVQLLSDFELDEFDKLIGHLLGLSLIHI